MNRKQIVLIIVTALAHFGLATLCVMGDTPAPGDYHDYLPILTMFMMAPFLATGASLVIGGAVHFWRDSQGPWLFAIALATMVVSFFLVYSSFGEPFMWLGMWPWVAFQYVCSLATICMIRWIYRKLG